MNDNKTIAVVATPPRHSNRGITVIKLGECDVTTSPSARNIGVVLDSGMSMEQQVTHVCQVAYWHLHTISTIRSSITLDAAVTLVLALVVSRLDLANALLLELPDCLIFRLQKVQNAAARMTVRAGRRDHISPILKRLRWLPIRQRIVYKALVLTFRGLHGLAPKYISVLLQWYVPGRHLQSASSMDLHVPRSNGGYGDRRFGVAAPRLWNSLPLSSRLPVP